VRVAEVAAVAQAPVAAEVGVKAALAAAAAAAAAAVVAAVVAARARLQARRRSSAATTPARRAPFAAAQTRETFRVPSPKSKILDGVARVTLTRP
jgi:hypothetical protein